MSETKIITNVADKTGMFSKAGMFTSKMNSIFTRKDQILNHNEPKMTVSNLPTSWVVFPIIGILNPQLGDDPEKPVFDVVKFEEDVLREKEERMRIFQEAQLTKKHLKQPFEKQLQRDKYFEYFKFRGKRAPSPTAYRPKKVHS